MDPLTQTLDLLHPRALLWKQLDASGDWAVRFPAAEGVVFSLVVEGRCVFGSDEHDRCELGAGDFLLMTRPARWSLAHSDAACACELEIHSGPGIRFARIGVEDGEPQARIIGGGFAFSGVNRTFLDDLLPPILVIRPGVPGAARLRRVLDLLADEAVLDQPGHSLALNRLLELMLIEIIRRCPETAALGRPGLLAGLADPQIASALRGMHADVQRSWTVGDLARMSGMSRSVFAEKFSRVVGLPPIDYLLRWRMALAKDALLQGQDRLAVVAQKSGYRSVSAFSAAFARTVGCPPSRFQAQEAEAASVREAARTMIFSHPSNHV